MLMVIAICVFIVVTIFSYFVLNYYMNRKKYIYRINNYIDVQKNDHKKEQKNIKSGLNIIGSKITRISFFENYKNSIQKELTKAHIPLKGEEFITISVISFIITSILLTMITRNIIAGVALSVIGWFVPTFFIKSKKRQRVRHINNQLADAIVLISNSLKAGYSFFQAVDMVSKEMPPPISEEFFQMQKEINLGYTTEQALENLGNRVESDDLALIIIAVLTQRQVGGNLAEILDNISGTIRDRIKIKGEIKTLTAQGRISGMIITAVPIGLGVVLQVTNPEYIGLLFKNQLGWGILALAVVMQAVGIYSINKIIKIEV